MVRFDGVEDCPEDEETRLKEEIMMARAKREFRVLCIQDSVFAT